MQSPRSTKTIFSLTTVGLIKVSQPLTGFAMAIRAETYSNVINQLIRTKIYIKYIESYLQTKIQLHTKICSTSK